MSPLSAMPQDVVDANDQRWGVLAPSLASPDASTRRAAVTILTKAVLGIPQPRCMDPGLSHAERVLYGIQATELTALFEHCRESWKKPPEPFASGAASHYEQVHRMYKVIGQLKGMESFAFEEYVLPQEGAITRLALFGMAAVYSDSYKTKLAEMQRGSEPLASLARDALSLARR